MKKRFILAFLLIPFLIPNLFAQDWETLGPEEHLFVGSVFDAALDVDNSGIPYVAYFVEDSNFFPGFSIVETFDSASWSRLPRADAAHSVDAFALDGNNIPYLASESSEGEDVTELHWFDGSDWISSRGFGSSDTRGFDPDIAFSSNNEHYISNRGFTGIGAYRNFEALGEEDSEFGGALGFAGGRFSAIVLDSEDTTFVASDLDAVQVHRFDGDEWQQVGGDLALDGSTGISMVIDNADVLYVAYRDVNNVGFVKYYDGNQWKNLGDQNTFEGIMDRGFKLDLDALGNLYIVYSDLENSVRATVQKFNGNSWGFVGAKGFSVGKAFSTDIAVDVQGKITVSYLESFQGRSNTGVVVKVFDPNIQTGPNITGFGLVDADTDQVLFSIREGDIINLDELPTQNLNVVALTTTGVESVRLELHGIENHTMTENVAPYALFADRGGDFLPHNFVRGSYELSATPYSQDRLQGVIGDTRSVSFSFIENECENLQIFVVPPFFGTSYPGADNGKIEVEAIGGVPPYRYSWSNGQTSSKVTNLPEGEYTVTVTDANNCTSARTFEIGDRVFPFITTWKTDNPGNSFNRRISIQTVRGLDYDFTVDWGDGQKDENVSTSIIHTYDRAGTYQVMITGQFPGINFGGDQDSSDALKLLSVDQWGGQIYVSMEGAFNGCQNMDVTAQDAPDLRFVRSTANMFMNCNSLVGNSSFDSWNMGNIRNMTNMFAFARFFDQPVGRWDLSEVRIMEGVFSNCDQFNQDLGEWEVEKVTTMKNLFLNAGSFDQNLAGWNVTDVKNMESIFDNSNLSNENYDKILLGWSQIPSLENGVRLDAPQNQFCLAEEARQQIIDTYGWTINDGGIQASCQTDQIPFITTWRTGNVGVSEDNQITIFTSPEETYNYTIDWGDGSQDIGVTGNITHTYSANGTYSIRITGNFPGINFGGSSRTTDALKLISVDQWGSQEWRSLERAFNTCQGMDVRATDVPILRNVKSLAAMFINCSNLKGNSSFNEWNTANVEDMSSMFAFTDDFDQDIGSWDVGNVKNMGAMFYMCDQFNQDIGDWNVGSVTSMNSMFGFTRSFNQDIGEWDVGQVTNMDVLFLEAENFNQNLGNWDVGNVTTMEDTFAGSNFNQDISNWNVSSVTRMSGIFAGTPFNQDIGSWNVSNVSRISGIFTNSALSNENYDKILIGWSQLPSLQNGLDLGMLDNQFCLAEDARQQIIDTYGWTINDGGRAEDCNLDLGSIVGFYLIDADNDTVLFKINDGDQINLSDLPTLNLNIEAVTTEDAESVRMDLSGAQSVGRTENVAPYALFGDRRGDFLPNSFTTGSYTLTAMAFSMDGAQGSLGNPISINFSFTEAETSCEDVIISIVGTVMNPTSCDGTNGSIALSVSGGQMPYIYQWSDGQDTATAVNLTKGDYLVTVTDVRGCASFIGFALEDPGLPEVNLDSFTEVLDTDGEFVLTGGSPAGGEYSGPGVSDGRFDPSIGAGRYSITYTFTDPITNCTSSASNVIVVTESRPDLVVTQFLLVNADTNRDIGFITQDSIITLNQLPTLNLNIRAQANSGSVNSVFLELTGPNGTVSRRENVSPYALFGDSRGNYAPGNLTIGNYTLKATPYSERNLQGDQGQTLSINFTVEMAIPAAINPINLSIYPNPSVSSVMATFDAEEEVQVEAIQVFDVQGRLIRSYDAKRVKEGDGYRLQVYDMPVGSYFLRTTDAKGFDYQQQMVIER